MGRKKNKAEHADKHKNRDDYKNQHEKNPDATPYTNHIFHL